MRYSILDQDPVREYTTGWIVVADPEGNEFCVCDGVNLPDVGQRQTDA